MNFLEIPLHKTSPAYRAGLVNVFEHSLTTLQTCMLRLPFMKSEFLQITNQFVYRFENAYDADDYKLGLYAASGWFQHALHTVDNIYEQDAAEIVKQLETIIQDIKTADTK